MVTIRLIAVAMVPTPMPSKRKRPVVEPISGRVSFFAERRVTEPARARRMSGNKAEVEKNAAKQEDPEAEGVQPRQRHIAGADHQRRQIVRETKQQRHDDQENHRRPVHREDLVVRIRTQKRIAGPRELNPNQQRFDAAEAEEEERRDEVKNADASCDRQWRSIPASALRSAAGTPASSRPGVIGISLISATPEMPSRQSRSSPDSLQIGHVDSSV